MNKQNAIKIFEDKKIRTSWNEEEEEWYFSVVDVIAVLTGSPNPQVYWRVLKKRLRDEGNETVTNCNGLKLPAPDGKMRITDIADTQQIFRIIQSIPSPKAEPFKLWLAEIAKQRLDQLQDPELSIEQAMSDYKRLGYSDNWINQRLKSIEIRKDLTDEWKKHGLQEGIEFASLTDIIYKTWAGKTAKEYKKYKGLKKENLRDNMTNKELVINMLAELSTKEISEVSAPETFPEHEEVARRGGKIAKEARMKLEMETGKKVVSPLNAKNILAIKNANETKLIVKKI
jgi:prophage antirepressor-like protein